MIEDRLHAFGRTILLHQIEPRQRHIEPCSFRKFKQHELGIAVALVNFFQTLILSNSVLHVDDIVSDLQVAEVGKKRRHFRFLPLRARSDEVGFIEHVARAKNSEVSFRQNESVRQVRLE